MSNQHKFFLLNSSEAYILLFTFIFNYYLDHNRFDALSYLWLYHTLIFNLWLCARVLMIILALQYILSKIDMLCIKMEAIKENEGIFREFLTKEC